MKTIQLISLATLMLWSCNESEKGKWSDSDVEAFYAEMDLINEELEYELGSSKKEFVDCYFKKIQETFESYNDLNDHVYKCKELADECKESISRVESE